MHAKHRRWWWGVQTQEPPPCSSEASSSVATLPPCGLVWRRAGLLRAWAVPHSGRCHAKQRCQPISASFPLPLYLSVSRVPLLYSAAAAAARPPPTPSLSVCRSLAQLQGLLFSFAHLTSCPAHSPALSLTSITVLVSCTARVSSQAGTSFFFFLSLSLLPLKW